tara:strand:+ start:538 stop:780 length:243 start_codon:yes stop_codon:yes gene_type:complete
MAFKMKAAEFDNNPMKKNFPDLTGDGKVTQADILKGRGVFKKTRAEIIAGYGSKIVDAIGKVKDKDIDKLKEGLKGKDDE